jgi:hypothetical protein
VEDPGDSTATRRKTRVTSYTVRSNVRLRDYALVERFVLDYARYPELPGAGPPNRLPLRARAVNLAVQARLRQPWESETMEAWRRRTAAQALVRIAKLSTASRHMVGQTVAAAIEGVAGASSRKPVGLGSVDER